MFEIQLKVEEGRFEQVTDEEKNNTAKDSNGSRFLRATANPTRAIQSAAAEKVRRLGPRMRVVSSW